MLFDGKPLKTWILWWWSFFVLFSLLFSFFYFSQGKQDTWPVEQPTIQVRTQTVGDFSRQLTLEKPGTILSSQDIQVTAQANGKVARILSREWALVQGGQPIVQLSDTIASYKLQAERAKNWLDRAILTKNQTEISINQQIQQAENAYKQAQQSFDHIQKSSDTAIKQAWLGLSGAESQFEALKKNFLTQKTALLNTMNGVIDSADALLGVTPYYEDQLRGQEVYIWAKNESQKNQTKEDLKALYRLRDEINTLADTPSDANTLLDSTKLLNQGYEKTIAFSRAMQVLMENTIPSEGTFWDAERNRQLQLFQNYQVWPGMQQARSAFLAYSNQVEGQLNGSSTMDKEKADLNYSSTLANSQNSIFSAEIALKNAKVNYETLLANKDIQLDLLNNAITDAKIAYESALIQYNKLQVRSPVSGVIGTILVSEGQEVGAGTPIFKVSGTKKQQIEVYLTAEEYHYLSEKEPVLISYQNQLLTGLIDAMSSVADRTNLFKATIQLATEVALVGDVAKVSFPLKVAENTLLPLDMVKVLNENVWSIQIFSGGKAESYPVKIQRIWWSFVELKEALDPQLKLLLNSQE